MSRSRDADGGGYAVRGEHQRTREWSGDARASGSAPTGSSYERPSPEVQRLTRTLRGTVAEAGMLVAQLESAITGDAVQAERAKHDLAGATARAEHILAALAEERIPAGCLDATIIRDAKARLEELAKAAASVTIEGRTSRRSAEDPRLAAVTSYVLVEGRDAADVRRAWITGNAHPQADRIRTDRMLEILVALRAADRFVWATDADLDAAACAHTRLPSDQAGPIVTLELGIAMCHHAGLPQGEPGRVARHGDGLEVVFAVSGGARDGEWTILDDAAIEMLGHLLERTVGSVDRAALKRLASADLRVLIRHGAAHLVLPPAQCAGLLIEDASDSAMDFANKWLATNLELSPERADVDPAMLRIIRMIDCHPARSAIIDHARSFVAGGRITAALLETLAHDAIETGRATQPVKLRAPDWTADAAAMATMLNLGLVDVRSDAVARTVTEGASARGVAHAGVVHLHPERIQPGTPEGREVLAHELIHLAQARLPRDADGGRAAAEQEAAALAPAVAVGSAATPRYYIDLAHAAADGDATRTVVADEPTLPPGVDMQLVEGADAVLADRVWLTGSQHGKHIRPDRMREILDAMRATGRLAWAVPGDVDALARISTTISAAHTTKVVRVDLSASAYFAIGLPPGATAVVNVRGDGLELTTRIPGLEPDADGARVLDDDAKAELAAAIESAVGVTITTEGSDRLRAMDLRPTVRHGAIYLRLSAEDCHALFDAEQWRARTSPANAPDGRIVGPGPATDLANPELDYQVTYPPRPATEAQGDAIARLEHAYTVGEDSYQDILVRLVPDYLRARDNLDANETAALGGQMLGQLAVMHGAHAALPELIRSTRQIRTTGTSAEEDLRRAAVQEEAEARVVTIGMMIPKVDMLVASTLTPHVFHGQEVAGEVVVVNVEYMQNPVLTERFSAELARTVSMLLTVDEIVTALASEHGQIRAATLDAARDAVWPWRSRPLDLAFLRAVLGAVWDLLDASATGKGSARPSDALAEARAQVEHTGWLGDIGSFDLTFAVADLEDGGREAAERTLRQLYTADPDARAGLLVQLQQRGLLPNLCNAVGWADIKRLHDSLGNGFHDLKHALQPYFIGHGKWGPDITQEWNYHDVSLHSLVARAGVVGDVLNAGLDFGTFGFNSSYGKAVDAYAEGLTSESEMHAAKAHTAMRTALTAAASIVTGGAADGWVRGGAGAVSTVRAIGGGVAGGAVGATTTLVTSDAYNVFISGEQEHFSSPEEYVKNALIGGAFGGTLAGIGQALDNRPAAGDVVSPADRPAGALAPDVADAVDAVPVGTGARIKRVAGDVVSDVGATVKGAVNGGADVEVPATRKQPPEPGARADQVVRDQGTAAEHAAAERHRRHKQRGLARHSEGEPFYEGQGAEIEANKAQLVREGGKVKYELVDPFTGDLLYVVDMPNGRRISLFAENAGGPRITEAKSPRAARKLQRKAEAARERIAARDTALSDALAALPRDDQGNVLHLFEEIDGGAGTANVLDRATSARRVSDGDGTIPDVISIAERPEPWATRTGDTGQPPHELDNDNLAARHSDVIDRATQFAPTSAHADVLALTADREHIATAYGHKIVSVVEIAPGEVCPVEGARVRIEVSVGGVTEFLYTKETHLTLGPGPGRRLEPFQLGAKATMVDGKRAYSPEERASAAAREKTLMDSGRLVIGDEHLADPRPAAKVLVSGGSATAGWSTRAVAEQTAASGGVVDWVARPRGATERPRLPGASKEVDRLAAELERTDLTAEQREYLERRFEIENAFGDADLVRNRKAFSQENIHMSAKEIVEVRPSEEVTEGAGAGIDGKVVVTFSDGSVDVYDYVVVAHGPDPRAAGGIVDVTQNLGALTPVFVDGQLAELTSASGAVSIRGSSIWSAGWEKNQGRKSPIVADQYGAWLKARSEQPQTLPEYSRGVPDSFAMAYRSIAAANSKGNDEQ